jgi:hypothetical protein
MTTINVLGKGTYITALRLHGLCPIKNLTPSQASCEEKSTGPEKINAGIKI